MTSNTSAPKACTSFRAKWEKLAVLYTCI